MKNVVNPFYPTIKEITVAELLSRLNGAMRERQYAYKAYSKKYTCFEIKLAACEQITMRLAEASACIGDYQTIAMIIKLEKLFEEIAPRSTSKLYSNWKSKTEALFQAGRSFIGRRQQ